MTADSMEQVWRDYKATGASELRDQLITHYLFVVKQVVSRLAATLPKHVCADDLYATGVIGLIKAVERFDLEKKNKFETYALFVVRGAILDEMRALDWVPRSVHQKAQRIADAQSSLRQQLGRDPSDEETAKDLNLDLGEFQALLSRVHPVTLIPLDAAPEGEEEGSSFAERLADVKAKTSFEIIDRKEFAEMLRAAIGALPKQESRVLVLYYYENLMLKEIGKILGVSESRVSQIHTKAVLRLRGRLEQFVDEFSNMI